MEETDEDLEWARSVDSSIQTVWISPEEEGRNTRYRPFGNIQGGTTRTWEVEISISAAWWTGSSKIKEELNNERKAAAAEGNSLKNN